MTCRDLLCSDQHPKLHRRNTFPLNFRCGCLDKDKGDDVCTPGHKKKAFCGVIYCSNRPWQQLDSIVITINQAPKKRLGHSYSLDLRQEADGHSFTMGCNISNRVTVAQVSSEELQNNQEAKSQTTNDSIAGTEAVPSQDGAAWPRGTSKDGDKFEDETGEADSHEERFTSSQKSSNAQSTDALLIGKFVSKSWPLQETERQKPSDILEELRMQGIIKSPSTTARTGETYDNKRDALEETQKKPPAMLEKIQFGNKKAGDFTVKDNEDFC